MNELLKKLATDYTDNTDYLIIGLRDCWSVTIDVTDY